MLSHLAFISVLLGFALSDCPPNQVVAGRQCTVTCGEDRPGGDYAHQYTGSFQACITLCGMDPVCQTAQYNEVNGYCYLKNSVNSATPSMTVDTVDCGKPGCRTTFKA